MDKKPPEIARTDEIAMMYPAPHSSAVVTALVPPKVLPTNEMNPPVDGWARENSDSVLPSSATATPGRDDRQRRRDASREHQEAEPEVEAVGRADVRHRRCRDVDQPQCTAVQPFRSFRRLGRLERN